MYFSFNLFGLNVWFVLILLKLFDVFYNFDVIKFFFQPLFTFNKESPMMFFGTAIHHKMEFLTITYLDFTFGVEFHASLLVACCIEFVYSHNPKINEWKFIKEVGKKSRKDFVDASNFSHNFPQSHDFSHNSVLVTINGHPFENYVWLVFTIILNSCLIVVL